VARARLPRAPLDEHDGFRGAWLRTPSAEVFVAVEPRFRVLAFARPGRPSLMADVRVAEQGTRLAFMGPDQVKGSFDVGNVPADFVDRTASTARVRLAPAAGLRYDVTLALDADRPRLRLDYALENVAAERRTVACWSVTSFARGDGGAVVVPFGAEPRARRRLVLPWWTRWPQPNVRVGRDAIRADVTGPVAGGAYKDGLITDAGWIAFARGGEALVSSAPFDASADYAEDGANVTFFESDDPKRTWCEIEQVGPLRDLPPGESARLSETL
jgi:hypothetical protein